MATLAGIQKPEIGGSLARIFPAPVALLVACVLIFVFLLEQWLPVYQGNALIPSPRTMIAFGALDPPLMARGEWWRFFVSPFLHGGPGHLVEDLISLVGVGIVLEPLLGRARFGATLALGAVASSLCSYWWLAPNSITFGSSGAVMSILAANFVYSFHFADLNQRKRLWHASGRYLVPMLIGTFNEFHGAGAIVDIGGHVGGTIAGGLFGLALLLAERREGQKWVSRIPAGPLAVYLAVCFFGLIATILHYHRYAETYAAMIPWNEFPRSAKEALDKSAYFVTRYPNDPESHLFRGKYYLTNRQYVDAEWEFSIAQSLAKDPVLTDDLRNLIGGYLALALWFQGRRGDALVAAKKTCRSAADDNELQKMQLYLLMHGFCS